MPFINLHMYINFWAFRGPYTLKYWLTPVRYSGTEVPLVAHTNVVQCKINCMRICENSDSLLLGIPYKLKQKLTFTSNRCRERDAAQILAPYYGTCSVKSDHWNEFHIQFSYRFFSEQNSNVHHWMRTVYRWFRCNDKLRIMGKKHYKHTSTIANFMLFHSDTFIYNTLYTDSRIGGCAYRQSIFITMKYEIFSVPCIFCCSIPLCTFLFTRCPFPLHLPHSVRYFLVLYLERKLDKWINELQSVAHHII